MPGLPIDCSRESAAHWRREIVRARIRVADAGLSPAQRDELWQVIDCQEWCLRVLVEDFPQELERIDRDIEAALRRVSPAKGAEPLENAPGHPI